MGATDVLEEKLLQILFDNSVSSLSAICMGNQDFLFKNIVEIKNKTFPFLESVAGIDATLRSVKEQVSDGNMNISDKSLTKDVLTPIIEITSYIDKLHDDEKDTIESENISNMQKDAKFMQKDAKFMQKDAKLMDLDHLSVFAFNHHIKESILTIHRLKLKVNKKYESQATASLNIPKK